MAPTIQHVAPHPTGGGSRAKPIYQRALDVLQARLRDVDALSAEWHRILELDGRIVHDCDAAVDLQNGAANRYVNVLPYDYNRVRLQGPPGAAGKRRPRSVVG